MVMFCGYAQAAFSYKSNGQLGFRYGIHGCAEHGNIKRDRTCKPGADIYIAGKYLRISRYKQNIVKREALGDLGGTRFYFAGLLILAIGEITVKT